MDAGKDTMEPIMKVTGKTGNVKDSDLSLIHIYYLDKIEPQDVKKEFLTLDEVKQLAATPCDIPVLKSA